MWVKKLRDSLAGKAIIGGVQLPSAASRAVQAFYIC